MCLQLFHANGLSGYTYHLLESKSLPFSPQPFSRIMMASQTGLILLPFLVLTYGSLVRSNIFFQDLDPQMWGHRKNIVKNMYGSMFMHCMHRNPECPRIVGVPLLWWPLLGFATPCSVLLPVDAHQDTQATGRQWKVFTHVLALKAGQRSVRVRWREVHL